MKDAGGDVIPRGTQPWPGETAQELKHPSPLRIARFGRFDVQPFPVNTYSHMKTTIEISDSLLEAAKRLAAKEGTTVRAYVEQGLRRILAERKSPGQFRLRKTTFKGKGLQPGMQDETWERIRETIYQGRGG